MASTGKRALAVPNAPRRPQQERGLRRVAAILDATAAIVAEEGAAAVTMQAIARRSGTTIGSLYHFFPDRETVFEALLQRHGAAFGEVVTTLAALEWSRLTLDETVDRFVDGCVGYVRAHPDLLPVAHTLFALQPERKRDEGPDQLLFRLTEQVVAAHAPRATTAQRAARAAMILAAIEGAVERWHRVPTPPAAVLERELKRMLVGYLGSFA